MTVSGFTFAGGQAGDALIFPDHLAGAAVEARRPVVRRHDPLESIEDPEAFRAVVD